MLSKLGVRVRHNVVAYLALFFALTGVAYAAGPLKEGDPAGGDLTGTYPNPSIAASAVNSAKVSDDSLTGNDILESSLGQVPSAASVDNATNAGNATQLGGTVTAVGVTAPRLVTIVGGFGSPVGAATATINCPDDGIVLRGAHREGPQVGGPFDEATPSYDRNSYSVRYTTQNFPLQFTATLAIWCLRAGEPPLP
jgi:hypothetical protein